MKQVALGIFLLIVLAASVNAIGLSNCTAPYNVLVSNTVYDLVNDLDISTGAYPQCLDLFNVDNVTINGNGYKIYNVSQCSHSPSQPCEGLRLANASNIIVNDLTFQNLNDGLWTKFNITGNGEQGYNFNITLNNIVFDGLSRNAIYSDTSTQPDLIRSNGLYYNNITIKNYYTTTNNGGSGTISILNADNVHFNGVTVTNSTYTSSYFWTILGQSVTDFTIDNYQSNTSRLGIAKLSGAVGASISLGGDINCTFGAGSTLRCIDITNTNNTLINGNGYFIAKADVSTVRTFGIILAQAINNLTIQNITFTNLDVPIGTFSSTTTISNNIDIQNINCNYDANCIDFQGPTTNLNVNNIVVTGDKLSDNAPTTTDILTFRIRKTTNANLTNIIIQNATTNPGARSSHAFTIDTNSTNIIVKNVLMTNSFKRLMAIGNAGGVGPNSNILVQNITAINSCSNFRLGTNTAPQGSNIVYRNILLNGMYNSSCAIPIVSIVASSTLIDNMTLDMGSGVQIFNISNSNNLSFNNVTNNVNYLDTGAGYFIMTNSTIDTASTSNIGWWPLLTNYNTDIILQSQTAYYNGTSGYNADLSPNSSLHYYYNNNGYIDPTAIYSCQNLIYNDTIYNVMNNLTNPTGTCLYGENLNNVTINGNGYTLSNLTNLTGIGFRGSITNVRIYNLNIETAIQGIVFNPGGVTENITIENITCSNVGYGATAGNPLCLIVGNNAQLNIPHNIYAQNITVLNTNTTLSSNFIVFFYNHNVLVKNIIATNITVPSGVVAQVLVVNGGDNVTLDGYVGINNILRAMTQQNATNVVFRNIYLKDSFTRIYGGVTGGIQENWTVENVLIEGNRNWTTNLPMIGVSTAHTLISNVTIRNVPFDSGTGIITVFTATGHNVEFRNVILRNITSTKPGIIIPSIPNILFINVSNRVDNFDTIATYFTVGITATIDSTSSGNIGWFPMPGLLNNVSIQSRTALYNGTSGGYNANLSPNPTLHYYYGNNGCTPNWIPTYTPNTCPSNSQWIVTYTDINNCDVSPPIDNGTIQSCVYIPPAQDNVTFLNKTTTDLNTVANISAVENFTVATSGSAVQWVDTVNLANITALTDVVQSAPTYITVNIAAAPSLNTPAEVALTTITHGNDNPCQNFQLYYANGYFTNPQDIIANGQLVATGANVGGDCIDPSICTNVQCTNGVLTFTAQHFDGFALGTLQTDAPTNAGLLQTRNLVYAGLALLAVLILVIVSWGLIQAVQSGTADFMAIAIIVIGGGIIIMVAYVIIYFVFIALGGT